MTGAVMWLVAQAIEIPEIFRDLGIAGGVVAGLFITGVIVAGTVARDWKALYLAERAKNDATSEYLMKEVMPLLGENARVLNNEVVPVLAEATRVLRGRSE